MSRRPWSPDELSLLRRRYPDSRAADIAAELGRPLSSVYGKASAMGLEKSPGFYNGPLSGRTQPGGDRGASGRFKQGRTPSNKGVKGWQAGGRSAETRFKKGNLSGKAVDLLQPLGAERINKDGIRQRKISMDAPLHLRWKSVHSILWEEHHGPIPPGHIVVFRNGDRSDIRIENLELITRAENLRRNSIHNLPEELADVCRVKGRLTRRINKLEKGHHEKQDR